MLEVRCEDVLDKANYHGTHATVRNGIEEKPKSANLTWADVVKKLPAKKKRPGGDE